MEKGQKRRQFLTQIRRYPAILHGMAGIFRLVQIVLPNMPLIDLAVKFPLNGREALVEDLPVRMEPEIFQPESARPAGKPLGRAEWRDPMTAPTGVKDGFVLGASRTKPTVDILSAVGNTLAGVAPENKSPFPPLGEAGKLVEL